ncbi:MAG: outer membrane protein [Marinicella sp.]
MKNKLTLLACLWAFNGMAQDNMWKGCYFGGFASFAENSNQWTTNFIQNEVRNENAGSKDADDTAIGAQLGCDFFENDNWVLGVKISASDAELTATHLYQGGTGPQNTVTYHTDDVVSLISRVGFKVNDEGLLYGQLGYTQSSNRYEDNDPDFNPDIAFRKRLSRNGITLGLGYEHRLSDQFSLFAEYNYTDLGKERNVNLIDTSSVNIFDYLATFDQDISQFNIGVNFSF